MVQMIPDSLTRDAFVLISNEHMWSMWLLAACTTFFFSSA